MEKSTVGLGKLSSDAVLSAMQVHLNGNSESIQMLASLEGTEARIRELSPKDIGEISFRYSDYLSNWLKN